MLARRLTTILPAMTLAEAIETTRIHRVPGLTSERTAVVTTRPIALISPPPSQCALAMVVMTEPFEKSVL
jgi:predicted ATPase with chaperone activity